MFMHDYGRLERHIIAFRHFSLCTTGKASDFIASENFDIVWRTIQFPRLYY